MQLPQGFSVIGAVQGSTVVRAVDCQGREVALKVCEPDRPGSLASLRRGVGALRRRNIPGVAALLGEDLDCPTPWYATEWIHGESFKESINTLHAQNSPSWEQLTPLIHVIIDICHALAHLHALGIVHGDLTPSNVMLQGDGSPILVDLDLSAPMWGMRGASTGWSRELIQLPRGAFGTPEYMAPEQVLGELLDGRSDLYAVGCLLYHCLSGRPVFTHRNPRMVALAHLRKEVPSLPFQDQNIPADLWSLTLELLAKEAQKRPGHADTVANRLRQIAGGPESKGLSPQPPLFKGALVGRRDELARLGGALKSAENGRVVAIMTASSGMGKTRLAMQVAKGVVSEGGRVLVSCSAHSPVERPALGSMHELLETVIDGWAGRDVEAHNALLEEVLPVLASHLPRARKTCNSWGLSLANSVANRRSLFRAIDQLVSSYFGDQIGAIVFDDLQWADPLTSEYVEHLATSPKFARRSWLLLLLSRGREDENSLGRIIRKSEAIHIDLRPFTPQEIKLQLKVLLAQSHSIDSLSQAVVKAAEGKPLFVGEYLRAAMARGLLKRSDWGIWSYEAQSNRTLPLPQTLEALQAERLDRLRPQSLVLARVASILGRTLELSLLLALSRQSGLVSEQNIEPLIEAEVLNWQADGRVSFEHDSLREVCYKGLPKTERIKLHRLAAQLVEKQGYSPERQAFHFREGGCPNEARPLFLEAANQSLRQSDLQGAIRYFNAYFDLSPPIVAERLDARLSLTINALLELGDMEQSEYHSSLAMTEAQQLRDETRILDCLRAQSTILRRRGKHQQAKQMIIKCVQRARAMPGPLLLPDSLIGLGESYLYLGAFEDAQISYEEVLNLLEGTDKYTRMAVAEGNLAIALQLQGKIAQSIQSTRRSIEQHQKVGRLRSSYNNKCNLANTLILLGQFDEAKALTIETRSMALKWEDYRLVSFSSYVLGMACVYQGRLKEAESALEQSLEYGHLVKDVNKVALADFGIGYIYELHGLFDKAAFHYGKSRCGLEKSGDTLSIWIIQTHLDALLGLQGQLAQADSGLNESFEALKQLKSKIYACSAGRELARVKRLKGQYEAASALLKEAEGQLRPSFDGIERLLVDLERSKLCATLGAFSLEKVAALRARILALNIESISPIGVSWLEFAELLGGGIVPPWKEHTHM